MFDIAIFTGQTLIACFTCVFIPFKTFLTTLKRGPLKFIHNKERILGIKSRFQWLSNFVIKILNFRIIYFAFV